MSGLVGVDGRALVPDVIRTGSDLGERRDPTAATVQMTYLGHNQPLPNVWNAQRAIDFQYYANIVVYRCVQIIARAISSLPFRVGPRPPDRAGLTAPYNEDAPLARLLGPPPGGPAPKLSARRLWAWTIAQRIVTGRHAWELELADGPDSAPVAFWPLTTRLLKAYPSEAGTDWWSAFEYGLTPDKAKKLRPDQVFYGWDPSMNDFRQAESALQAAKLPVELARMMDVYNVAFLRNDARPAAVVVTEQFNSDAEYQQFKRELNEEHGGPSNAGKAMVVEATSDGEKGVTGAIDIKVLGLSQKDALFVEQHQAALVQVAMAIGVPWSILDASGRTFDNASEEGQNFWRITIASLCETLADEVNLDLAPRLGNDVGWFDLSGIPAMQTKPDPVTAAVGAPTMVQAQLMWINEARADYGLPPTADGDRFMTVDEITALKGTTPDVAVREALVELREAMAAPPASPVPTLPPADPTPPEDRGPDLEAIEARRSKLWRTADATVRTLEKRWAKAWARFFTRQQRTTLARLEGKRGRQTLTRATPDGIFDPEFWATEAEDLAEDLYALAAAAGVTRISDLFGVAFDLDAEWAQDFISARAKQLAGQVTDTTYQAITDALAAGAAEGEGIPDLAARVRHVFDVASKTRSTTIARTEVISAYNGSASLGAAQLPDDVVGGQEWISTRDGRTRVEHADCDGQIVAMGAPFSVGGSQMAYPGDPAGPPDLVVNCRCTVAFLTPDEYETAVAERTVPVGAARALITMLRRDTSHDRIRQALQEMSAA